MARKQTVFDLILSFPWWINLILSCLFFFLPNFINLYLQKTNNKLLESLNQTLIPNGSKVICIGFLIFIFFQLYNTYLRKKLFNNQNTLNDLYNISWSDFEYLVTEVFYRDGFKVSKQGGAKADGGIDLLAYKDGFKTVIQCKHWKSKSVGVSVVREMFAVCIHENARQVVIVTCGYFTKDAKDFAKGKPILLVNGYELINWINKIKGV